MSVSPVSGVGCPYLPGRDAPISRSEAWADVFVQDHPGGLPPPLPLHPPTPNRMKKKKRIRKEGKKEKMGRRGGGGEVKITSHGTDQARHST